MTITLTPGAVARLKQLTPTADKHLRITVSAGGCSGFQYSFELDDTQTAQDHVIEQDGARLVTDDVSFGLIDGCTVDFIEDLASAKFVIKNPNAAGSCGCGNSFTL